MTHLKFVTLFLIFLTLASCSHSPSEPTENFDHRYSKLTENKAPGFHILVMKQGNVLRQSSFGFANLKTEQPITTKTKFRIASNTKAFTAAAALLLQQDGLLNIEDNLGKFFPEFPVILKDIKVKHLISHTSGLPEYDELCQHQETTTKVVNNKIILKWLMENPKVAFKPGSKFAYSNTGYIMLASVIEKVTNMSFPAFIQTRIFDPLKMTDTLFFTQESEHTMQTRALGYNKAPWYEPKDRDSCNYTYGDDGIYTNGTDLGKWALGLSEGKLFKPKFQKKIFESGSTDDGKLTNYSYGWSMFETDKGSAIAHSGSWVGFRSYARYYPDQMLWILVLANSTDLSIKEIIDQAVYEYVFYPR